MRLNEVWLHLSMLPVMPQFHTALIPVHNIGFPPVVLNTMEYFWNHGKDANILCRGNVFPLCLFGGWVVCQQNSTWTDNWLAEGWMLAQNRPQSLVAELYTGMEQGIFFFSLSLRLWVNVRNVSGNKAWILTKIKIWCIKGPVSEWL